MGHSLAIVAMLLVGGLAFAQETISLESSLGEVRIVPLGHASLRIVVNDMVIHVDPWSDVADYSMEPDANLVLVTHDHPDHFDPVALEQITGDNTTFVMDGRSAQQFQGEATALANGEAIEFEGVTVTAVPAYNIERMRDDGTPYHPEGVYNGYLLEFGDLRVHIGGDTECVPEIGDMGEVDVSFLPINLPFTMPPEETAACYRTMNPRVAVPYHQGDFDPQIVADMLVDTDIDVRVLPLR